MNRRILSNVALASLAFGSLFSTSQLNADSLRTPFESLPEETQIAARFDNSAAMRARYEESTQLGKLLFSEERIEKYKSVIEKMISESGKEESLLSDLAEVGLVPEDLYAIASSHVGAAMTLEPMDDPLTAMPTLLAWAEMEPEDAQKLYAAVLEAAANDEGTERTDQELAGVTASRLRDKDEGDSFLVALLGNRFLFAIGLPTNFSGDPNEGVLYEEAEWRVLGKFIAAQQNGGSDYLSRFYGNEGVGSVLPDFESRLEILGEAKALLGYLPPKQKQLAAALDVNQFGKVAVWSGLVGKEEKSVMFLEAPTPRVGIAQLIDVDSFEFSPPAWVPSSVISYSNFAFDFTKFLDVAKGVAGKFMAPAMIDQQLEKIDDQLQQSVQADLATVLASFGKSFHAVEFPVEKAEVMLGDTSREMLQSPQAVVVEFSRPDILEAATQLMAGIPGTEAINEQGFVGTRATSPQGTFVVAHGLGKIVIASGPEGAASRVFSAMNNPPQGEAALVNDPDWLNFQSNNALKPGIAFSYAEGDKVLKNLMPVVDLVVQNLEAASTQNPQSTVLLDAVKSLFPTEEELSQLVGYIFSRVYATDHGLVAESFNEYK